MILRTLIQRPVAVFVSVIALVLFGLVVIKDIPVSLLPEADIPQLIIKINHPNSTAEHLEENVVKPIRENFASLRFLTDIESKVSNHNAIVNLTFDHGTKMDMAFIEANEKLDQLHNRFPDDLERPIIVRVNTTDVPILRIQIIPKNQTPITDITPIVEKVIKKRLEQIDGVSVADINGQQRLAISVTPKKDQLLSLNLTEETITRALKEVSNEPGNLNVRNGKYRYFLRFSNSINSLEKLSSLPVRKSDGSIILLNQIASIDMEPEEPAGYHLYNEQESIVVTVHKQSESKMNELLPAIKTAIGKFEKDYPNLQFYITQNQNFLLDAGIDNLIQDLVLGGILTILLLFLFLGNWVPPVIMGISIPLSLIITFIFFYIFNITFNIISLSGLALGVGMLIDNSIVVVDNIIRKRKEGYGVLQSSIEGTNEVVRPVISQVLTTIAVYLPLILLHGLAGILVFDQSIALTISLCVSLFIAFFFIPLLCSLFINRSNKVIYGEAAFYKWISRYYHRMIDRILKRKLFYFILTISLMPVGFFVAKYIPITNLPAIEKKEGLIKIDWNEPIDATENLKRTRAIQSLIKPLTQYTEAEVGIQNFLFGSENRNIQMLDLFYSCKSEFDRRKVNKKMSDWLSLNYPFAKHDITDAPNAFTQLFITKEPYLEARFKPVDNNVPDQDSSLQRIISNAPANYKAGDGLIVEYGIELNLNVSKLTFYGISVQVVEAKIQQLLGNSSLIKINRYGDVWSLRLSSRMDNLSALLSVLIKGGNNVAYPLKDFVQVNYIHQPRFITADVAGRYQSIYWERATGNMDQMIDSIKVLSKNNRYSVEFNGAYFKNKDQAYQLWKIFLIVLLCLYVILAIQYESLIQPLLVMLTIPLGVSGGMFFLWLFNGTLDVMSAIGFIVVLGLIVDDPILKVEILNRLEKKYIDAGHKMDNALLEKMIHEAGEICLKPLLMVSLTTSIALVPVLFIGGIGNDLQKPLALVIIGGLTIGTFFTTWFIPLAYWYLSKRKQN